MLGDDLVTIVIQQEVRLPCCLDTQVSLSSANQGTLVFMSKLLEVAANRIGQKERFGQISATKCRATLARWL